MAAVITQQTMTSSVILAITTCEINTNMIPCAFNIKAPLVDYNYSKQNRQLSNKCKNQTRAGLAKELNQQRHCQTFTLKGI